VTERIENEKKLNKETHHCRNQPVELWLRDKNEKVLRGRKQKKSNKKSS